MALSGVLFLLFCVYLISSCTCSDSLEGLTSKDAKSCEDDCEKTYPLHTYPKAEHLECCRRGCRLFALINAAGDRDGLNSTYETCSNSCGEAYPKNLEKHACISGCSSQLAYQQKQNALPAGIHPLQPLMYVQTVYNHVVGPISQFVASTWTLYVQEDTGKVVIGKDASQIMQDIDTEEVDSPELGEDKVDFGTEEIRRLFVVDSGQQAEEFLHIQESGSNSGTSGNSPSSNARMDWLGCLSRQSGLPRKLLLVALLLAVVVLVWLSCATAATAPTQRVKNVQVYNDLSYLLACDSASQVKIQPPSYDEKQLPPNYEDIEAAPLPEKTQPVTL